MAQGVRVIVLRTAGTNCDGETAYAFGRCGAAVDLVHINRLMNGSVSLRDYHILAVPGGFTYGDDIISGRILANELRLNLGQDIEAFIVSGKLVIGICNGFQVLVRAGILPGPLNGDPVWHPGVPQAVSLTYNDSGKFEDRWVRLKVCGRSVWTEGLPDTVLFPVAHAEGKFVTQDEGVLHSLQSNGQVVFRYCSEGGRPVSYPENPNGSMDHIAGIADRTGRVLGLMPHPERHFVWTQHPAWTRLEKKSEYGDGAGIFQNGVAYAKKNLV